MWDTKILTPPELMGRFAIEIEGGSVAPRNLQQDTQLAQTMMSLVGDPDYDQKALKRRILHLLGMVHPEAFIVADDLPTWIQDFASKLQNMGVRPSVLDAAVAAWQRENPPAGKAPDQSQNGQQQLPEQAGQPS